MKKITIKPFIFILLLILVASCVNDELLLEELQENASTPPKTDIKLLKKLENPYSVINMRLAMENLKLKSVRQSKSYDEFSIETTHLYVKFSPQSEEELDLVKKDSTLVLYDYPLDYEISEGSVYRDPNVSTDIPTPQYCSVKVDYDFPQGVTYEVLEELFIPDENVDDTASKTGWSSSFINNLVDESLRLTGNLEEDTSQNDLSARSSSWRPAGKIEMWDETGVTISRSVFVGYDEQVSYDYTPCYTGDTANCPRRVVTRVPIYNETSTFTNWAPVEGVEVRARRWFTTHRGTTNAYGEYRCNGTFRRPANYSIDWERYDFALQDGWLNGATYNGPKIEGDWDLALDNGIQQYYATIFRAAHHYYYGDRSGLRRPPENSFWRTQLKIRAYPENVSDDGKLGTHKEERRFLGAQIKMYTYGRLAIDTYSTVIHELAHASHWNMVRNSSYDESESRVKESWARGVEWELTRKIYPKYKGGGTIRPNYTQLVVDMIDPNYSSSLDNENRGLWNDDVSGYSIRQIEDALQNRRTWEEWETSIINLHNNPYEKNLPALFDFWN